METKELFFVHFAMGPLMLIISLVVKIFPPKKINWFYGYRTRRSMQSQEAWVEANSYSTNALVIVGVCTSFFQLITYWLFELEFAISLAAGFLVIGLFAAIFLTERHLRSKGFN